MVKAVIFDLGNVIVPFDFKRGYARMEGRCAYAAAEIPGRLRSTDLVTRFERGLIEPREFVRELAAVLELNTTYEEFCELWTSIFMPETLLPEALLERIAARRRLMLLSNTNAIHFAMLERSYPLLRHFHDRVLSYRVGALKPSSGDLPRSDCARRVQSGGVLLYGRHRGLRGERAARGHGRGTV